MGPSFWPLLLTNLQSTTVKFTSNKHSLEYANEEETDLTGPEIPKGKEEKKFNIEFHLISKPLSKWP